MLCHLILLSTLALVLGSTEYGIYHRTLRQGATGSTLEWARYGTISIPGSVPPLEPVWTTKEVEGKKEVDVGSRYGWEQFLIVSSPEDGYEGGVDEEKGLLTSVRSVRVSIQLFYDKSTSLFLSDTSQGLL